MQTTDQVWRDPSLARLYLEGVRGAIPFAAEQIELMLRILDAARPGVGSFLDLGCGDGVLGYAVLRRHPAASGVFLDFSETMLEAARKRLADCAGACRLVCRDYGRPDWIEAVDGLAPFDAVVSGFSIHHQPDARKREIYGEIHGLLRPGGVFLNLEHVASASPWGQRLFDEHFVDALAAHHRRASRPETRDQIAHAYYHRDDKTANILAPVELQCSWLRELGFERVDCFFKAFELALFGGVKPGG
jgi:SAM-dependent methyltransferase